MDMKREIKFRVWDGKEMVGVKTIDFDELGRIEEINTTTYCWSDRFETPTLNKVMLMQYTGLKDKNGKEIYEGDILQGEDHWSWGKNWKQVVEFTGGHFYPFGIGDWEPDIDGVKVIGNIYENPELIK